MAGGGAAVESMRQKAEWTRLEGLWGGALRCDGDDGEVRVRRALRSS